MGSVCVCGVVCEWCVCLNTKWCAGENLRTRTPVEAQDWVAGQGCVASCSFRLFCKML